MEKEKSVSREERIEKGGEEREKREKKGEK
jgi:hypothetical protein